MNWIKNTIVCVWGEGEGEGELATEPNNESNVTTKQK